MEEKLKLNKQEIENLVLNLSDYESAYLKAQTLSQNSLTLLWLIYLLIPAIIGSLIPSLETTLLTSMVISFVVLLKLMPKINQKIINLYLTHINKSLGHQVFIYNKYSKIIKKSVIEALHEGSHNNYLQKVVIKTLAQSK